MTDPTPDQPRDSADPATNAPPPGEGTPVFEVEETPKPAATIVEPGAVAAASASVASADDSDAEGDSAELGPFVVTGRGTAQHVFYAGVFLLMAAMIATAMSTTQQKFPNVVLTAYLGAAHTITGVTALVLAARLAGRPFGSVELASARMLVAVAAFLLGLNIGIKIDYIGKVLDTLLALAGYSGALWLLFRFTRETLIVVVTLHAAISALIYFGGLISAWAAVPVK